MAVLLACVLASRSAGAQPIAAERAGELNIACHDALKSNWHRWTIAGSMIAVGASWFVMTRLAPEAEADRSPLNAFVGGTGLGILASGLLFLVPNHSTQSYRVIDECELILNPTTDPTRRRVAYRFANRAFGLIPSVHETAWMRMGAIAGGLATACAVVAAFIMPSVNERLYSAAACLALPSAIVMDMIAPIAPVRAAYQLRRGRFRASPIRPGGIGVAPVPGGFALALSGSF